MQLPPWLQRVKDVWMKFSHALGMVMSRILLTILWIVVFGIYAIITRIVSLFTASQRKPQWHDVPPEFEGSMRHQF